MYSTELRVCLPQNQDNSDRDSMRFNHISLMPNNAFPGSIDVETPISLSELRVRLPPITENNSNLSRSSSRISSGTGGRELMRTTPSIQGRK